MNVRELRNICEYVEKEVGPDAIVHLQIRDHNGRLIDQDCCDDVFLKPYRKLVLGNYKLENKEASRPWKTGADTNLNSVI